MKKRKTLGLLVNSIDGNYQTYVWLTIKRAAEILDCNLIAFEGRSLCNAQFTNDQHHIVFDFVSHRRLDGIIILSAALANYITKTRFMDFAKKYKEFPVVSVGLELPGFTSLLIDNKEGMRKLMRHLVCFHGYKRLAFIKGPENSPDAIERFEAYCEVLEENGIELDGRIIFKGDFTVHSGYTITEEIIKIGIEYDALVCANDDTALAALKCINDTEKINKVDLSKYKVICGFDDSLNSCLTKPSLTTVKQPIEELGYRAVEILLEKINGREFESTLFFPSILVQRESCGCIHQKDNNYLNDNYLRIIPSYPIHEKIQTYDKEELFDRFTQTLKICYIKSCFLSTYLGGTITYNPDFAFNESFQPPLNSELIYCYQDNERRVINDSIKGFNTRDLIPDALIPHNRRFTFLVNPLFFKDEHFGFLCFEIENDDVINTEPLRGHISNSLKGALMLYEREQMEKSIQEKSRLASLGQLIGGISHNVMTPIMSISGACEALGELIEEYCQSIGDKTVSEDDHMEIVKEMRDWLTKLKGYNSYMSDIISTVKKQSIQLNSECTGEFSIDEMVNRINTLKRYNLNFKKSSLNINLGVDPGTLIKGDISNLMQVIENIVTNAIHSYKDDATRQEKIINIEIQKKYKFIEFSVRDFGRGIPEDIKSKLFRHMITTKGRNGTGVSLMLSYLTIKGKFEGDMWFESQEGIGTTFYFTVPIE